MALRARGATWPCDLGNPWLSEFLCAYYWGNIGPRESHGARGDVVALAVVLTVVVALLTILVAGLLRSHADILRALHSLGAGVGDPVTTEAPGPVPIAMSPPLPGERNSISVFDLSGSTPSGDGIALSVAGADQLTLIAFLSSGCTSCAGIWKAMVQTPEELPQNVRLVVATKGPEFESPPEVAARASGASFPVVMSTEAWGGLRRCPAPVLRAGRRPAEPPHWRGDRQYLPPGPRSRSAGRTRNPRCRHRGCDTEPGVRWSRWPGKTANDAELIRAGILPGDPSLYPKSHDEVFGVAKFPSPSDGTL